MVEGGWRTVEGGWRTVEGGGEEMFQKECL